MMPNLSRGMCDAGTHSKTTEEADFSDTVELSNASQPKPRAPRVVPHIGMNTRLDVRRIYSLSTRTPVGKNLFYCADIDLG